MGCQEEFLASKGRSKTKILEDAEAEYLMQELTKEFLIVDNSRPISLQVEKNYALHYVLEFADEFDVRTQYADELKATAWYGNKITDATRYVEEIDSRLQRVVITDSDSIEIVTMTSTSDLCRKGWSWLFSKLISTSCMDWKRDIASEICARICAIVESRASTNGGCMHSKWIHGAKQVWRRNCANFLATLGDHTSARGSRVHPVLVDKTWCVCKKTSATHKGHTSTSEHASWEAAYKWWDKEH